MHDSEYSPKLHGMQYVLCLSLECRFADTEESLATDELRDRMITLMNYLTSAYGRYTWLEARTRVPAQKWANLYTKRQQPTAEQVLALCTLRPECSEWLLTGATPRRFPEDPSGHGVNSELNGLLMFAADEVLRPLYQLAYDRLTAPRTDALSLAAGPGFKQFAEESVAQEEGRPAREPVEDQLARLLQKTGRGDIARDKPDQ